MGGRQLALEFGSGSLGVVGTVGAEIRMALGVKFVVDFLPDELYKGAISKTVISPGSVHTPSSTSSRVIIPRGMTAGSTLCKNYDASQYVQARGNGKALTSSAFSFVKTASAGILCS